MTETTVGIRSSDGLCSIHLLTFSLLNFLSNKKSRASVNALVPAISADMTVHTFNDTAILLIVIHFSLSTTFVTTPHPLLSSSLFAFISVPSYRFPFLSILDRFNCDLLFSFRSQIRQMIRLLIVFSENVLHVVVNFSTRYAIFLCQKRYSMIEIVNWVCTRVQKNHEWNSKFLIILQENTILVALNYDIDVPCTAQWRGDCFGTLRPPV